MGYSVKGKHETNKRWEEDRRRIKIITVKACCNLHIKLTGSFYPSALHNAPIAINLLGYAD
jgi:hypothetical protein